MATEGMFDRLAWREDRMLLDDLVFRLEPSRTDWELGEDCFLLYKDRSLIDQYAQFWTNNKLEANNILELGIWDGGSIAFWFEYFQPEKHVAVDLSPRGG